MRPKCPEHGTFLSLVVAQEVGKSPDDCYKWWTCTRFEDHYDDYEPIPAPEYQWLYCCEGIPFEDLLDWPELLAEYTEMWNAMPKSYRQKYKRYSPANVNATRR